MLISTILGASGNCGNETALVRHPAWRTIPVVACGGRAWRRTRHPAAKAAIVMALGGAGATGTGAPTNPAAKAEVLELANVKHVFVKAAARLNNRAESSHQPTRERERRMRGFRNPKRTQRFLSCFGPIRQHFALERHLLRASLYRKQLAARFVTWSKFMEVTENPSTAF